MPISAIHICRSRQDIILQFDWIHSQFGHTQRIVELINVASHAHLPQGMRVDELEEKLCNNEGPKVQATQPDYVKFHDDKVTIIECPMGGIAYCSIAGLAAHDLHTICAFNMSEAA